MRFLRSLALVVAASSAAPLLAQDDIKASTAANTTQSGKLDVAGMQTELLRLQSICESLELTEEASLCRNWLPVGRQDQSLLYLPVEPRKSTDNPKQAAWVKHFEAARSRHAEYWFDECRKAVDEGDELRGYQLLWRTLRENSQHPDARRTLGRLATSAGVRPIVRRSTSKHPTYGWPGNSYGRVESPHFLLTSRANTADTIELAMKLEEFYSLWTQYFFPLWSPPGLLKSRLSGGVSPFESQRQIKVMLLKDRADYIEALGAKEQNIGVSVGYYDPKSETSYFFPDKNLDATFYHELTHQLLAEATRLKISDEVGSTSDVWLLEGVALYMESLWRGDNYWTLGGWDAPRLQTARYRAIRDGFFVPWPRFSGGTLNQWKSDPDIAKLYSQAAGITHVMLDGFGGEDRAKGKQAFFQSLVALYQGAPNSLPIFQALGGDNAQQIYESALTVTSEQVVELRPDRKLTELVLSGSELNVQAWQKLSELSQLEWLDVSFCNASPADLRELGKLRALERLSLEGTRADAEVLEAVRNLPKLNDLDLTGCPVDDAALKRLAKHPQLSTLWLGKTQATDAALPTLASMPRLKFVDIQDSKITPAAWQEFLKRYPRFEVQK